MKLIDQYEKAHDKFRAEQTKSFEDRAKFLVNELRKIEPGLTGFNMGMGSWGFDCWHEIFVGEGEERVRLYALTVYVDMKRLIKSYLKTIMEKSL